MTASFRVVAPGKLMVAGEYSVLGPDGYALAFAVSPGLTAACRPAGRWRLERADIPEPWEEGQPVPGTFRYVHAALDRTAPPHSVVIARAATGAIGAGARKPGVGGSASAAVLGAAISLAARGEPLRRDTVLAGALTAHAAGQGGRGSGYDVATIVHGGLVLWRPARLAGGVSTPAGEARRLEWPKGLHVIAGYTGQSASTTRLLGALEARAQADSVGTLRRLARLGEPVRDLAEAFEDRDVQRVLVALARCHEALLSWDAAERLGVMTPAVGALVALAGHAGAVAKVSGAGGGDSVLAFSDCPEIVASVAEKWRTAGYLPLPVAIDFEGVRSDAIVS